MKTPAFSIFSWLQPFFEGRNPAKWTNSKVTYGEYMENIWRIIKFRNSVFLICFLHGFRPSPKPSQTSFLHRDRKYTGSGKELWGAPMVKLTMPPPWPQGFIDEVCECFGGTACSWALYCMLYWCFTIALLFPWSNNTSRTYTHTLQHNAYSKGPVKALFYLHAIDCFMTSSILLPYFFHGGL